MLAACPHRAAARPRPKWPDRDAVSFSSKSKRVDEDIALGMKLRRLLHSLHGLDLRQDFVEQTRFVQQQKCAARMPFSQHSREFVADPLTGNRVNLSRLLLDRFESCRLDLVVKAGREADRSQHAELVFGKAMFGFTNGSDDSGFQILLPTDVVKDLVGQGIEQQAVDSEITAKHIFPRIFAKAHFVGMAAIAVSNVRAKRGDLNDFHASVIPSGVRTSLCEVRT